MQIMNNEILQMVRMKLNKHMLVPPHCTGKHVMVSQDPALFTKNE
jgi:hypothetical protein